MIINPSKIFQGISQVFKISQCPGKLWTTSLPLSLPWRCPGGGDDVFVHGSVLVDATSLSAGVGQQKYETLIDRYDPFPIVNTPIETTV